MFMKSSCHGNAEFKGRALSGVRMGESDNVIKAGIFSSQGVTSLGKGMGPEQPFRQFTILIICELYIYLAFGHQ